MSNYDACLAKLNALPPSIAGQGGHRAAFKAACTCIGFGLSDDDALRALGEFNRRCAPPWSDKELRHKINDARKAVTPSGGRGGHRPGRPRAFDHAAVDRRLAELRSRPVASMQKSGLQQESVAVAINPDTDGDPVAAAMAHALEAAARHPDYQQGACVMRQTEEVESIYWATVWARLGVPDPGLLTVGRSSDDCQNMPEHAEVPHA